MTRKPIQVEAFIFRKTDKGYEFLILKRIPKKGGFWQPITGGVEDNETPAGAVVREVKEESGIIDFLRIIENVHYFTFNEPEFREEFVFGIEVRSSQDIDFNKNVYLEHDEYSWCLFEKAMSLLKYQNNKDGLVKLNTILISERKKI